MLSTVLGWISGPFLNRLVGPALDAYKARLAAGNDADRIAAEIVGRELDVARREAELRSAERMAMRWHHPAMLMGYILVAYVGKIVVFDTMLGLGETPAIRGAVGDWLGMVATFFVGVSGVASAATSVAAILKRR